MQTNNGTTGTYFCAVSNSFGGLHSSNAVVQVVTPPAVSIAYLRTLVDPTTYLATNSTLLYSATGTVTTFTNLTTGNTSSYYLQDSTAGINIFATFGSTFRPAQGDVVTFVGFLSSFNSTLELGADTGTIWLHPIRFLAITLHPSPLRSPLRFRSPTISTSAK